MQDFIFELSDGKKIVRRIEARDKDEALRIALTALSTYSSSTFPPPERIEITVSDAYQARIATLRFTYEIELASDKRPEIISFERKDVVD